MIEGTQEITFNGNVLSGFGCIITEPPKRPFPKRRYEKKSVYGRNGDLLIDSGAYDNIKIVYKVSTIPGLYGESTVHEMLTALKAAFCTSAGYMKLYDTELPGGFYWAFCAGISDAVCVFDEMYEFSITFDCKPFFYFKSGLTTTEYTVSNGSGIMMDNPGTLPSKPMITLYGNGDIACYIMGQRFTVENVSVKVTVDCERMLVYKGAEDKVDDFSGDYLEIPTRRNMMGFSGSGLTSVKIMPRWCRL